MNCSRFEDFAREGIDTGDKPLRLEPNRCWRQPKGSPQPGGALRPDALKRLAEALDRFAFRPTLPTNDSPLRAARRKTPPPGMEPTNACKAIVGKTRAPKTSQEIDPWRTRRIPLVDRSAHKLRIRHLDLLALPRR